MKRGQTIPKKRRGRSRSKKYDIGMDSRENRVLFKPPFSIGDRHRSRAISSTAVAFNGGDMGVDGENGENKNRVEYSSMTDGKSRCMDNFESVHTHRVTKLLYRVAVNVDQILVKFHRISPPTKLAFYVIVYMSIFTVLQTASNLTCWIHI